MIVAREAVAAVPARREALDRDAVSLLERGDTRADGGLEIAVDASLERPLVREPLVITLAIVATMSIIVNILLIASRG